MKKDPVRVGPVVGRAAKALGMKTPEFLKAIEAFARLPGGDTEFSKTMAKDYHAESKIKCSWQFASAVLDYLSVHKSEIVDDAAFREGQAACVAVLTDSNHRLKRYGYFVTDILPRTATLDDLSGPYAVVRRDTGDSRLRQELLILHHSGSAEKAGRTLATLITPEIVSRGIWGVSSNTLYVAAFGRRMDLSGGVVAVECALPEDSHDVFGGILLGKSSIEGVPVVLPLLAIKVPSVVSRGKLQALCDASDAHLRATFTGRGAYSEEPKDLAMVLDSFTLNKDKRLMEPRDLVRPLRALGRPLAEYILPGIIKFLDGTRTRESKTA
ncbi:MAG: hypothetical protein QOJ86_3191 [Bradyrhizobium sp.]|nr:hypothetical protein [Bradyrhizobium sp.]